jgi:ABC-type multidrug transport system fused ATPase/permease subunit
VTQTEFLFDDTVYNNIAYGNRKASREELEAAAKLAGAHDFIVNELGAGYETRVGEAGEMISGGQKQRIALARAILRDPSILILDEFTSQIDAPGEVLIQRALREFAKGRTTFIITHRLHTLEMVDRIVVLDQGRIVAVGKHNELLGTCPLYQMLYEASSQKMVA